MRAAARTATGRIHRCYGHAPRRSPRGESPTRQRAPLLGQARQQLAPVAGEGDVRPLGRAGADRDDDGGLDEPGQILRLAVEADRDEDTGRDRPPVEPDLTLE